MHLEIQRHRKNPYGIIRSSFRENGRVRHRTFGRISGLSLDQLICVQASFRGQVVPAQADIPKSLQTSHSREFGASAQQF